MEMRREEQIAHSDTSAGEGGDGGKEVREHTAPQGRPSPGWKGGAVCSGAWEVSGPKSRPQSLLAVAQEGARETRNPGPHLSALRKAALTIREDSATGGWAVGALEGLAVTIRDLPHPGVAVSRARQ